MSGDDIHNDEATRATTTASSDVEWREYNIHETEAEEESPFVFQQEEEWQELEYRGLLSTSQSGSTILTLTYQENYLQSTGTAIWRGSEVMADYLIQHPQLVQNKAVLELGAGAGLVGLVAHYLGSAQVVATDGDEQVLVNLRRNIERNTRTTTTETSTATENTTTSATSSPAILCPQLIWGKDIESFRDRYGMSQVILGTDLFYITKSYEPLFYTVDRLLTDDGIFLAIHTASSQSPMETALQVADKFGFDFTTTTTGCLTNTETNMNDPNGPTRTEKNDCIYIFTKRK